MAVAREIMPGPTLPACCRPWRSGWLQGGRGHFPLSLLFVQVRVLPHRLRVCAPERLDAGLFTAAHGHLVAKVRRKPPAHKAHLTKSISERPSARYVAAKAGLDGNVPVVSIDPELELSKSGLRIAAVGGLYREGERTSFARGATQDAIRAQRKSGRERAGGDGPIPVRRPRVRQA